jgi:hypothetical protein
MANIRLNQGQTMLLMADFSTRGIRQNLITTERQTLERARAVLDAARTAEVFVGYGLSHVRPGVPEVLDRQKTRAARRDAGDVLPADPTTLIHPAVQPQTGEPVLTEAEQLQLAHGMAAFWRYAEALVAQRAQGPCDDRASGYRGSCGPVTPYTRR